MYTVTPLWSLHGFLSARLRCCRWVRFNRALRRTARTARVGLL